MNRIFLIVSAFLLIIAGSNIVVEAIHIEKSVKLKTFARERWQYITRFGCGAGQCEFSFKIKMSQTIKFNFPKTQALRLRIVVYTSDDTWPKTMDIKDIKMRTQKSKFVRVAELPVDGTNSETYTYSLPQGYQTRLYYFFLSDVEGVFGDKTYPKSKRIEIDFTMKDVDGSHTSQEERGMLTVHLFVGVFFAIFTIINLLNYLKLYKKDGENNYPLILLNTACCIEFLALLSESLHLLLQEWTGSRYFVPNLFNSLFSIISQLIVSSLLVLIASGWTINYSHFEDTELLVFTCIMAGFFHITFAVLGQAFNDDPFNSHDYEHWAGVILIIFKVMLFGAFLLLLLRTYHKINQKLQSFTIQFGLLGSVYLLSLPVTVLVVSTMIETALRHRTVTISFLVLESVTLLPLTYMLTSQKSSYHKVSYKGSAELPNNKIE